MGRRRRERRSVGGSCVCSGDGKGAAREVVGRREQSGRRRPAAMTTWRRNGTQNGGTIEEMADGERNGWAHAWGP
uniref:Uncharacterized protein n=1 Tax=Oryza barthii TaxID=65489 RepID=A0A0D3H2J4_9ORYZ